MGVTIKQIAEEAGVSRGTVDRALNQRGRINPEVAERILRIAESHGYVPKHHTITPPATIKIGVITFLSKRVFADVINSGIELAKEELAQWGIEILIRKLDRVSDIDEIHAIDDLLAQNIAGLALMPVDSSLVRDRLNRISEEQDIPIITFNTDIVGTHRLCFMGMDNAKGGQVAAGLMGMLTHGTGNILIVTGSFANYAYSCRVDNFVEELKNKYPDVQVVGVQCSFDDSTELENILVNALTMNPNISGILITSAGQDGLEAAFKRLNLPQRPYVIFYDKTPCTENALRNDLGDFIIEQDNFSQGYQAAYALANLLVKKQQPSDEYMFTKINIQTKYNL